MIGKSYTLNNLNFNRITKMIRSKLKIENFGSISTLIIELKRLFI